MAMALSPALIRRCPDTTKIDDAENGTHQCFNKPTEARAFDSAGASIDKGAAIASVFARFEFIELVVPVVGEV
jgi:ribonuclease HIII